MSRTRREDGGQASVELALVLPLVALVLLLVLQVGLVVRDRLLVAHAAREASRAAAVSDDDRGGAARRAAQRAGALDADHLGVTIVSTGGHVTAHVRYESSTDVPLVGLLLPDVTLEASATMRVESSARPGTVR
ncbi:MAG TPA: TadE/TadG family type IV pilus assembly protein [Acidimicrobiales bacterium]